MPNLKKVISLHQASQISGYHQDYLSSLIRKQEIRGEKLGGNWFTTEEEVENYIFKQKIRNKNWVIRNFLFFVKRINKSFVYAAVCLLIFSTGLYFYNQKNYDSKIQAQSKTEEAELSKINKSEIEDKFQELKF